MLNSYTLCLLITKLLFTNIAYTATPLNRDKSQGTNVSQYTVHTKIFSVNQDKLPWNQSFPIKQSILY